jgi:hypothetical protein
MGGAVPPLPNTPSWRGAQLGEHRDNFTFYLYLLYYEVSLMIWSCIGEVRDASKVSVGKLEEQMELKLSA